MNYINLSVFGFYEWFHFNTCYWVQHKKLYKFWNSLVMTIFLWSKPVEDVDIQAIYLEKRSLKLGITYVLLLIMHHSFASLTREALSSCKRLITKEKAVWHFKLKRMKMLTTRLIVPLICDIKIAARIYMWITRNMSYKYWNYRISCVECWPASTPSMPVSIQRHLTSHILA